MSESDDKLWFDYQKTAAESRRLVEKLEDKIDAIKREFLDELRVIINDSNTQIAASNRDLATLNNKVAVLESRLSSLTAMVMFVGGIFVTGIIGIAVQRIYTSEHGNGRSHYEENKPGREERLIASPVESSRYTPTRSR
ncbi:MAG: hypothetical protein LRZ84_14770 [Desertifilum sp.]|nr:hypothetical protein [Desertifilum sp.]